MAIRLFSTRTEAEYLRPVSQRCFPFGTIHLCLIFRLPALRFCPRCFRFFSPSCLPFSTVSLDPVLCMTARTSIGEFVPGRQVSALQYT